MEYCSMDQAQQQHQSPYSSALGQHHGSFSSVTSAGSAPSYDAYTPISSRSSSITDQRLDPVTSLDYDHCAATSAAFSNVSLDLTPPPSATAPSFFMSVPGVSSAEMAGSYLSSSSFPQPPATPDRHGSISSSQSTAHSPNSPAHVLSSSYPSSISSMSSVASAAAAAGRHGHPGGNGAMMCGPGTPDAAYPLTDVPRSHQHHQHHPQAQHQQHTQHHQQQHFQHQHQHKDTPPYMFPTPPPHHGLSAGDCGEISPSEFYWQSHVRPDSPIATFFDERPQMALPPPSATLKSSVVKRESTMDEATAAAVAAAEEEDMLRRYSVASSASSSTTPTPMRRRMIMDNAAQMKTVALQQRLGGQAQQQHHHQQHPHMQHHQQHAPSYGSYYTAANAVTTAGVCHDNIITRNGIQVSKVASGAFKCIVPGCPSRPFKRSEHLKRHVMTHHESRDLFPCEFCGRTFNRKDNWRSHLKLHTVVRGKNARTDYFAKAVHMYEDEMRKVSKSRPRKERTHRD